MNHVTHIVWFPHLVFLWDIPSSTQQTLVFWSPISTTQALLTPDPKDAQTDSYKNKQQSMSTTCTGICIKMHNYSKPCNCKHYFITCVSKGANINKYRNCLFEFKLNLNWIKTCTAIEGWHKKIFGKVLQMYTPGVGLHCQSPVSPVTGWPAALCVCG